MIPLLDEDMDLAAVFLACTEGRLDQVRIGITPGFACNVVVAAGGYPESYHQGDVIEFSEPPAGKKKNRQNRLGQSPRIHINPVSI
jgi:phosphoribosylamine-glycine ligase